MLEVVAQRKFLVFEIGEKQQAKYTDSGYPVDQAIRLPDILVFPPTGSEHGKPPSVFMKTELDITNRGAGELEFNQKHPWLNYYPASRTGRLDSSGQVRTKFNGFWLHTNVTITEIKESSAVK